MSELEILAEVLKHYIKNDELIHNVLDVLDPAKPYVVRSKDNSNYYACGKCHAPIDPNDAYCRHCGAQLDWKDVKL